MDMDVTGWRRGATTTASTIIVSIVTPRVVFAAIAIAIAIAIIPIVAAIAVTSTIPIPHTDKNCRRRTMARSSGCINSD